MSVKIKSVDDRVALVRGAEATLLMRLLLSSEAAAASPLATEADISEKAVYELSAFFPICGVWDPPLRRKELLASCCCFVDVTKERPLGANASAPETAMSARNTVNDAVVFMMDGYRGMYLLVGLYVTFAVFLAGNPFIRDSV